MLNLDSKAWKTWEFQEILRYPLPAWKTEWVQTAINRNGKGSHQFLYVLLYALGKETLMEPEVRV